MIISITSDREISEEKNKELMFGLDSDILSELLGYEAKFSGTLTRIWGNDYRFTVTEITRESPHLRHPIGTYRLLTPNISRKDKELMIRALTYDLGLSEEEIYIVRESI